MCPDQLVPEQDPDRTELSGSEQRKLGRAYRYMQQHNFREAEALCRRVLDGAPKLPAAIHLLGLIRKEMGDMLEGERLLRTSVDLAPGNAEFRTNLANLLRQMGKAQEAEHLYRKALDLDHGNNPARFGLVLALNETGQHGVAETEARSFTSVAPDNPNAWLALGQTLHDQEKWAGAESAYRQAIMVSPANAVAQHNLGNVLSRLEHAEEALEHLQHSRSLGIRGFQLASNLGRTYMQLYRIDEAEQAFIEAVTINPLDVEAQLNLARVRFVRGEGDFARDITAAAAAHDNNAQLLLLSGDIMRRAGDLQGAENVFRDLLTQTNAVPEVRSALAEVLHEMGRLEEAEQEAVTAANAGPDSPSVQETLVTIQLARGRADAALPYIRAQRAKKPLDQIWLAYEATAARLLDDPLYAELYDYDRFVRVFELEPPAGWPSIAALNAALIESLAARHRFPTHPLDQSLRNGSQTARSLVTDPDPAIRAVMQAFEAPLDEYRQALGTDSGHPMSARNGGPAMITGAWSIQLRREGFHVNHVHPEGWISSAYYVSVPDEVADENLMSGWIKFGEPRFPVPGADAEKIVQPHAGCLVLFPSYMWHGTNPICGDEPRTTIAFDARPADET